MIRARSGVGLALHLIGLTLNLNFLTFSENGSSFAPNGTPFAPNETSNARNETLFAPAKWAKTPFLAPFVPFPDGKSGDKGQPRRYRPARCAKSFITLRRAGSVRRAA